MKWLLLGVSLAACTKPGSGASIDFSRAVPPGTDKGPAAARVAGATISVAELEQRFAEMNPYARARYQTAEQRKDYVEGIVRFELLAREAVRRGIQNDPDVVEAAKRVMVQELLKQELDEKADAISDAQVKQYYESHHDDYVKPSMTRLPSLRAIWR